MRRPALTKLQHLEARHADLREKVHAMFNAYWPALAVQQLIEVEYGARLGLRSVERYKRTHWQAQHALIQQARGELAAYRESAGQARLAVRPRSCRLGITARAKTKARTRRAMHQVGLGMPRRQLCGRTPRRCAQNARGSWPDDPMAK